MRVRATLRREDGASPEGLKLAWRVPAGAGFAFPASARVPADGRVEFDTNSDAPGGHLTLGEVPLAAAPLAFDGKTLDYGGLVAWSAPRGGFAGGADGVEPTDATSKRAITTTDAIGAATDTATDSPTREATETTVTRTLGDTLVDAGAQIETARASTTSVSLAEVTVKWTGTAETEAVTATWKETAPTREAAPAPAPTAAVTPDLVGLTASAAARKAAAAGLRLSAQVQFTTDASRHGRVVRQLPAAGQPAADGVVTAYVARLEGS